MNHQIRSNVPYPYNLLEDLYEEKYTEILDYDQTAALEYVLKSLSDREQRCIQKRYHDDMTLEKVALSENVSRERIRQVIAKGLRKLRHPSRLKYIEKGYSVMSGELEKRVAERKQMELDHLEAEYARKITELQQKICDAENMLTKSLAYDEAVAFIDSVSIPIYKLDFSVRTYNCLRRARVETLGDLCNYTVDDLCKVRNLGRKSIEEVIRRMKAHGLKLKGETE